MGRRKIAIEPLTDDRNRTVTFVKRKAGLFKKAHELAVLCQVDLAVIIVGNNNKIYEFASVDTPEIIECYKRSKPHESKSPENYGKYKKKHHLSDKLSSSSSFVASPKDDLHDVPVDDADSDYDSNSPEPKRQKHSSTHSTPSSMYSKQPSKAKASESKPSQSQRPVLRVQIPSDAKNSSNDSAKTITALDTTEVKKDNVSESTHPGQPPLPSRFDNFMKLKGNQPNKNTPQLPVPTVSKSQTSSPSSAVAPQLPRNAGVPFFSSLPQASPGQYQPAILPTPVLNQVFNQAYMGQPSATVHPDHNNNSTNNSNNNHNNNNGNNSSNNEDGSQQNTQQGADNDDSQKFKHTFPGQFANPEQTPMSALPSRYVNDIFPSPSNLYPPQDWPSGMTSFPANMPHYFVSMVPSANGTQKSIDIDDEHKLRAFYDKRMGQEVEGESVSDEFKGYVFKITGGNDKQGFPMKQGVLHPTRVRLLLSEGHSCYRPRRSGERKRKSVRGCIVNQDLSVIALAIVKQGETHIEGLTDTTTPKRLGPKRANHIRKFFGLSKEDDVRDYVVRRTIEKNGKTYSKAPKIQRLVTPQTLQRKRALKAKKINNARQQRDAAAEYAQLLAQRLHERKAERAEIKKRRASSLKA
ncbi:hypothetical protein RJF_0877 [Candidozyma auris]